VNSISIDECYDLCNFYEEVNRDLPLGSSEAAVTSWLVERGATQNAGEAAMYPELRAELEQRERVGADRVTRVVRAYLPEIHKFVRERPTEAPRIENFNTYFLLDADGLLLDIVLGPQLQLLNR